MRRPWRAAAVVLAGVVVAAGATAAASCTTFNGVALPSGDAAGDTSPVEGGPVEASTAAGYLAIADAARVCSLVFRCPLLAASVLGASAVPIDPVNYSLCVHWLAGPIPTDRVGFAVQSQTFACMAKGTTCAAAGSCLSLEQLATGDPRCADAGVDASERCADDAGTVLRCAGGYALHCGAAYYAPGSQCLVGDDESHWCSTGTHCNVSASCIGSLLDYCGQGSNLHFGINCAFDGYTCGMATNDDSGLIGCNTGTLLKPCSAAGTSCSGDVVDVCDGFDESEFDCAALGGTCSAKGGAARCVRADDTCTPFDADQNTCTGTSISVCVGGQRQSFDCASVGLTCVPGAGASSGHCG
ncbi:MAG TPA: hypothetical protein VIF15_22375 [Polyangiaceae bacterium]|jgi:hypothetical protein